MDEDGFWRDVIYWLSQPLMLVHDLQFRQENWLSNIRWLSSWVEGLWPTWWNLWLCWQRRLVVTWLVYCSATSTSFAGLSILWTIQPWKLQKKLKWFKIILWLIYSPYHKLCLCRQNSVSWTSFVKAKKWSWRLDWFYETLIIPRYLVVKLTTACIQNAALTRMT